MSGSHQYFSTLYFISYLFPLFSLSSNFFNQISLISTLFLTQSSLIFISIHSTSLLSDKQDLKTKKKKVHKNTLQETKRDIKTIMTEFLKGEKTDYQ